jgi:DNA (cytosine-5)-methyltransferase 1
MNKPIKFIEMFCGIGGFRYGLERTNSDRRIQPINTEGKPSEIVKDERGMQDGREFSCVWANDNDKYACKIYRKNFGEKEIIEKDIRSVSSRSIPDFDLLTAGFPCQSFSIAGKRKGIAEDRGTLFTHIYRIAEAKRPELLLLENVKGLLSHDNGRTFAVIIRLLGSLGYVLEWQVLDSQHFGVPQHRERVFVVGHLGGEPRRKIFPVFSSTPELDGTQGTPQTEGEWLRSESFPSVDGHIGHGSSVPFIAKTLGEQPHSGLPSESLIASTISQRYYKDGSECLLQVGTLGKDTEATRIYDPEGMARTIKNGGGLGAKTGLYAIPSYTPAPLKFLGRNQVNYNPDVALTIDSCNTTGLSNGTRIRRLTPIECERLQGFPDNFTEGVSDSQRYKCLGNAVTTNVITFLGNRILEAYA